MSGINSLDDLSRWVRDKDSAVHVMIAARAVLRILPMLICARDEQSAPIRKDILLRVLHALDATRMVGTRQTDGPIPQAAIDALEGMGRDYDTGYPPAYDSGPAGAMSAYAAIAGVATLTIAVALKPTTINIIDTLHTVFDEVLDACRAVTSEYAGTFDEIEVAANAAVWTPVSIDAAIMDSRCAPGRDGCARTSTVNDISTLWQTPLWPAELSSFMTSRWHEPKVDLQNADPNWRVWIEWYEAYLRGNPATDDLVDGKLLIEEYIGGNQPPGARLSEDPQSGLLTRVPETIIEGSRYNIACTKICETIDRIRRQGLGNQFALDSVLIRIADAVHNYIDKPGFVRDRFAQSIRRIEGLVETQELDQSVDIVIYLLDDLREGVADIETSCPDVAATVSARNKTRAIMPPSELSGAIICLSGTLAEAAEDDIAGDIRDGSTALRRQRGLTRSWTHKRVARV